MSRMRMSFSLWAQTAGGGLFAACLFAACAEPQRLSIVVRAAGEVEMGPAEVSVFSSCSAIPEIGADTEGQSLRLEVPIDIEEDLGLFDPGSYGAYVRAWERSCGRVSAGCDEFEVPQDTPVVEVWLQGTSLAGCGEGMRCVQDACRPE